MSDNRRHSHLQTGSTASATLKGFALVTSPLAQLGGLFHVGPGVIDDATFSTIIAEVAAGTAIRTALRNHGVPPGNFYPHLDAHSADAERYARAKASGLDAVADDAMDIADRCAPDKDAVAKARLQVDTRKWLLAKLAPKKYGERTVIAGDPDAPLEHHHTAALVASKLLSTAPDSDPPREVGDANGSGDGSASLPLGILGAAGSTRAP